MARPAKYLAIVERNALVYFSKWHYLVLGFFEPLVLMLGVGLGVGSVLKASAILDRSMPYEAYVASGVLAASAMNVAVFESVYGVVHKLRYSGAYSAMIAAPLSAGWIVMAEVAWILIRSALYTVALLLALAILQLPVSFAVLPAIGATVLTSLPFAGFGIGLASHFRGWRQADLISLLLLPTVLLSGVYFPVSQMPPVLQIIAFAGPLYHGVELLRSSLIGGSTQASVLHVGYLVVLGVASVVWAGGRLDKALRS